MTIALFVDEMNRFTQISKIDINFLLTASNGLSLFKYVCDRFSYAKYSKYHDNKSLPPPAIFGVSNPVY